MSYKWEIRSRGKNPPLDLHDRGDINLDNTRTDGHTVKETGGISRNMSRVH